VHDAERPVAVVDRVDDHPEAEDVGELLEGDGFALHLAPDRVGALAPPRHLGAEPLRGELGGERLLDLVDELLAPRAELLEVARDRLEGLRVDVLEGQVLQLLAHLLDPHAAGERRIDLQRLLGDALALLGRHELEGAHVVQAVGELDQEHPDIVRDREQELAEVLALSGALGDEVEALDLGQPVHERADLRPERPVDLVEGGRRVLDRVVQHRRRDRGFVELEIRQDGGDLEGMAEEQVARGPLLVAVGHHRIDIRAIEQRLVGRGVVALHPLDEFVLAHHPAAVSFHSELIG
jgi:hypothetical protein